MTSKTGDPRLSAIWTFPGQPHGSAASCNFALLGFPHDEGVARNGGRVGSALGPAFLREHLKKIGPLVNPEFDIDLSDVRLTDFGDVSGCAALEELHQQLEDRVAEVLAAGHLPLVCGGGNDQSYRNARGLLRSLGHGRAAVVNVDAHLDVRPLLEGGRPHSGSPFRQLLCDPQFQGRFVEFAAQGNQCSKSHADFVKEKGGRIVWLRELQLQKPVAVFREVLADFPSDMPIFLSFDIDSIASAHCPGVSCPASIGLSAQDALDICFEAGTRRMVQLVDFSEYNPKIEAYRTGRLLANMMYYLMMGRRSVI